jgi:hypothetical protein
MVPLKWKSDGVGLGRALFIEAAQEASEEALGLGVVPALVNVKRTAKIRKIRK